MKVDVERRERMRALWEAGVPGAKIAAYFGVTHGCVCNNATKWNWARQPKPRMERMRMRWEAGASVADIAAELGVSNQTIYHNACRLGWTKRHFRRPRVDPKTEAEDRTDCLERLARGETRRQCAEYFGWSLCKVARVFNAGPHIASSVKFPASVPDGSETAIEDFPGVGISIPDQESSIRVYG